MPKNIVLKIMHSGYMKFHGFHGNLLCDLKEWVCTYKNTHFLAATHPRILTCTNIIPGHSSFLAVAYANYLISIFMNINANFRNERKSVEKV